MRRVRCEPDERFYIQHTELVRGNKQIGLAQDPPPDFIIEIDITGPSLNKFPIFAALGIPEVWRHDGARVAICTLVDSDYVERAESHGRGFRFLMRARMNTG